MGRLFLLRASNSDNGGATGKKQQRHPHLSPLAPERHISPGEGEEFFTLPP